MQQGNKKGLIWGIVIVIVIVLLVVFSGNKQSGKHVIKIGLVTPLTGPGSVFGNSFLNSIKLAQEDTPNTKNTYQIVVEDDGTNPAQSASAAQKLVSIDKVDALISVTSGTGNAVKPIATAAKIPHICICSDITVGDAEYNFTNLLLPNEEAGGWLGEAQKRGVKTIAILNQNQQGINAIVEAAKRLAPQYGITIVFEERWDPTVRDFKTTISKATATHPDLYYLIAFPPSLDIVGQQLMDLGIKNISSSAGFGISATPGIFEGLWYNDGNVVDLGFRDRFEKEFPGIRFNVRTGPYGYDSYRMLVDAYESGIDPYKYLSDLTEFDGKAGIVTKGAGTRNFHSQPGFWIIKDGKAEPLK